jgi:predicted site-specific integrase-resolvase
MPVSINGHIYFRTAEACAKAGISRNTLLRWIREGSFADVRCRDRKAWRLFSESDVSRLQTEVNRIKQPFPEGNN